MRKNELLRFDSEPVQGPGSYVVLRRPTWKIMRTIMKAQQGRADDAEIGLSALETIIPDLIVDWNWAKETEQIGNDGQVVMSVQHLQVPSLVPEVMDELDLDEMMFLMERVTPLLSNVNRPN